MTFVEGFYSFNLSINHVERNLYQRVRIKTPRHPSESTADLLLRVLVFCHCYRPGQEFSDGLFSPEQPTVLHRDELGRMLLWVQLGVPEKKKLQRALRLDHQTEYRIYFDGLEQIFEFCRQLRGSTSNWVGEISFFRIAAPFAAEVDLPSSSTWEITFVDSSAWMIIDELEYTASLESVDIWKSYQQSLEMQP